MTVCWSSIKNRKVQSNLSFILDSLKALCFNDKRVNSRNASHLLTASTVYTLQKLSRLPKAETSSLFCHVEKSSENLSSKMCLTKFSLPYLNSRVKLIKLFFLKKNLPMWLRMLKSLETWRQHRGCKVGLRGSMGMFSVKA